MQNVNFKSLDEFFDFINEDELMITEIIRSIIKETIPDIKERLSFNVPFFSKNKTTCFLWPGSILWGNKQSYTGVRLGFSQGFRMNDHQHILVKNSRKKIYTVDFQSPSEINPQLIKSYLEEAHVLDGIASN